MANLTIERYFADNYNKWLRRTESLCFQYYVSHDNVKDILHDAIRVVCEKNSEQDLLVLLSTRIPPYTLLDLWVTRAIGYKLMSFNKRRSRLRLKKVDVDVNLLNVADNEYTPRYDVYERQQHLSRVISEMNTDNWTKRILTWRLTENNQLYIFRGIAEHQVYRLYHTGLQQLQASINH